MLSSSPKRELQVVVSITCDLNSVKRDMEVLSQISKDLYYNC